MKILHTPLIFSLLLTATQSFAQQKGDCTDIIQLRSGSVYRGIITEHTPGGQVVFTTWSGLKMTVPERSVRRIVQRCKDGKYLPRPYSFREQGLYNATRFGALVGQSYFGDNTTGYSFYHSMGWMFNRWAGVGVGSGVELFNPDSETATFPLFAEVRGYFLKKRVTPFYAVGTGWAFAGKTADPQWGGTEDWHGGWLLKAHLGTRLGNHFALYGGLSLQRKTRNWQSGWWGGEGQDRILNKRLELGVSVLW